MTRTRQNIRRAGSVYLAVLATSLIVSLLALSALALQRVQNRALTATTDIRQAQLNAESAVELGLLAMKQNTNWRTAYSNGTWFSGRGTDAGTCTLQVIDPIDANLADDANDPVEMLGIGYSRAAEQRVKVSVDPRNAALACLRSAVAAGDAVSLTGTVFRASNSGLVSANSVSASSSTVYGTVKAVTISGTTYPGTTTTIDSTARPAMPDWSTVFDYYKTNGTEITIGSLPTATPNLGRNVNFANGTTDWTGTTPSSIPGTATIAQSNAQNHTAGGMYSLKISSRSNAYAGAAQYIDSFVKSNQQYTVDFWVYQASGSSKDFRVALYTKGSGTEIFNTGPDVTVPNNTWTKVSATVTAGSWSGNLQYAFVKIGGATSSTYTGDFYADDLNIQETTTGRFIYRQVLGAGVNPFGAQTNSQGIYWIDCGGNRLIIERSRIRGTLLVINPGTNSCIGAGPIRWSPAVPGYPALLVDATTADNADFAILATNRSLSEYENSVNYNPTGAPSDEFGQDTDTNDIYPSEIQGLIAIEDDLTYQNNGLVRGQIIVGDDITASSGALEIYYRPDSLLNPPPGFRAAYTFARRPTSGKKAVLP